MGEWLKSLLLTKLSYCDEIAIVSFRNSIQKEVVRRTVIYGNDIIKSNDSRKLQFITKTLFSNPNHALNYCIVFHVSLVF